MSEGTKRSKVDADTKTEGKAVANDVPVICPLDVRIGFTPTGLPNESELVLFLD